MRQGHFVQSVTPKIERTQKDTHKVLSIPIAMLEPMTLVLPLQLSCPVVNSQATPNYLLTLIISNLIELWHVNCHLNIKQNCLLSV